MNTVAAIDIGTVSTRLCIAEVDESTIHELHRDARITNLGEGLQETGRISNAAISRVTSCVDDYLAAARTFGTTQVCCTLTSAARDASNAVQLLGQLGIRGLIPQVISGDVEARLSFVGVMSDFSGKRILVADSGGGSTEFSLGPRVGELVPEWVKSVNVGCRRLTERFLADDPPSSANIELAHQSCRVEFSSLAMKAKLDAPADVLVMCGGTATSIVSMLLELDPYDSKRVHLFEVNRAQVAALEARLAPMSNSQKRRVVGLQDKRAPVILAGIITIGEILDAFGFDSFTVSESDLLYGLLICARASLTDTESPLSWKPELIELA